MDSRIYALHQIMRQDQVRCLTSERRYYHELLLYLSF